MSIPLCNLIYGQGFGAINSSVHSNEPVEGSADRLTSEPVNSVLFCFNQIRVKHSKEIL